MSISQLEVNRPDDVFQSETNVPVREVFDLDEDLKTSFFSPTKPQKPSSYDEVLRYQEIFQSGEINRGAKKFSERLSNNIHAEQQLKMSDIIQGKSGVRAIALGSDGQVIDDFKIVRNQKNIHVLNAPSPAATACLALGEQIMEDAKTHFKL